MKILEHNQTIDLSNTMYPSVIHNVFTTDAASTITVPEYASCYGYVVRGSFSATLAEGDVRLVDSEKYFCLTGRGGSLVLDFNADTHVAVFIRYGFKGQNQIGGPVEGSGRLVYIDNCSDSLLIYPPRLGDASLNHLHFPRKIDQSFHIHPSIRLGVVLSGQGISEVKTADGVESIDLVPGVVFVLEERENHRFKTNDSIMNVIAFHPDGDWGPTDYNHTMLNRTYVTK